MQLGILHFAHFLHSCCDEPAAQSQHHLQVVSLLGLAAVCVCVCGKNGSLVLRQYGKGVVWCQPFAQTTPLFHGISHTIIASELLMDSTSVSKSAY